MDIPHGTQLMNALFGGMTEASTETSALEKRLEFDLRRNGREVAITPHLLRQVAESLNVVPFKVESGDAGECALLCDKAVVVATASQLIITCDGDVKLHQAVNSVRELVEGSGYQVEWASFLRKNTSCPWDTRDATIAHEYAALKATFPSGKPFVFGPVDSDHYFYFVYDGIQRGTGTQESDVQLNVKLYNVEESDSFEVNDKSPLSVRFRAPQSYETLRWQRTNQGNVVSFESNGFIAASLASMKTKIDATRPERFTIMVLLDPHCDEATAARDHLPLGFEPNNFEGYSLLNRTTNTFEHGYLVIKLSYTCH